MSTSAELIKSADPVAALKALSDEVRAKPADSKQRVFMAQLLCVLGQWAVSYTHLTLPTNREV